jgi:dolichol-phosphate mannosyltransferase
MKKISVVIPIYNEEGSLPELIARCRKTLEPFEYELIFVDDRSADTSFEMLRIYAQEDSRIRIVRFSRNFGHQIAITAGIDYAQGDAVVIMDGDLQDPPELILEMQEQWEKGYEVVYARRRTRKDSYFKKATAFLFYRSLKRFANISIPTDTGDFRLMDRKVVTALQKMPERTRFMRGMTSWVGFKQTSVLFDRDERQHGETAYPLKKMVTLAIDGLTSFSFIPLRLATYAGFTTALLGFLFGVYALYRKFFLPEAFTVPGWTTIVIAIFVLGGIQLMILGILGEYVGRIYTEVKKRPLYLTDAVVGFTEKEDE